MRLNRFLAMSGVASRRGAEKLIAEGLVRVNGRDRHRAGHLRRTGEGPRPGGRAPVESSAHLHLSPPQQTGGAGDHRPRSAGALHGDGAGAGEAARLPGGPAGSGHLGGAPLHRRRIPRPRAPPPALQDGEGIRRAGGRGDRRRGARRASLRSDAQGRSAGPRRRPRWKFWNDGTGGRGSRSSCARGASGRSVGCSPWSATPCFNCAACGSARCCWAISSPDVCRPLTEAEVKALRRFVQKKGERDHSS